MANGDAAAAAGMDTVAGTADLRQGYDEDNKTRDYLAFHQATGTHDASVLVSGELAVARLPIVPAAKIAPLTVPQIPDLPASKITGAWAGDINTPWHVKGSAGLVFPWVYNNILSSSYRNLYINNGGDIGHVPSSKRFKQNIKTAPVQRALLAARITEFRYKAAVKEHGDSAPVELSYIAEELHELGLTEFVDYDEEGKPFSVNDRRILFAMVTIVQDHETRLTALEQGAN